MTLLSIVQDVTDEIGVSRPATLIGNPDPTARRLLAAAKAEGQALYRASDWPILQREAVFTTEADEDNYPVPEDFGRLIQDTAWDRTLYRQMRGGLTPGQWQGLRSGLGARTAIRRSFRVIAGPLAGSVLLDPIPTETGDELVYEYISAHWCESTDGTGQPGWLADSDQFRLDHELFRLGVLWRARRSLGMAYADDRADAEMVMKDAIKADLALPVVNLGPQRAGWPYPAIPEANWPGS